MLQQIIALRGVVLPALARAHSAVVVHRDNFNQAFKTLKALGHFIAQIEQHIQYPQIGGVVAQQNGRGVLYVRRIGRGAVRQKIRGRKCPQRGIELAQSRWCPDNAHAQTSPMSFAQQPTGVLQSLRGVEMEFDAGHPCHRQVRSVLALPLVLAATFTRAEVGVLVAVCAKR